MSSLFPVWNVPLPVKDRQKTAPSVRYRGSYRFDFEAGEFVLDGRGDVERVDGYEAWAQWCVKTALTERYSALIYSRRYGVELSALARGSDRAAAEADLARTLTEALSVDRRTRTVREFAFAWEGDGLHASMTVVPHTGTEQRIEVRIRG